MYQRILVPLDGSKRAESILSHVENLAGHFEAEVIFLKVVESEVIYTTSHGMAQDFQLGQKKLDEEVEKAKTYLSGLAGEFDQKNIPARTVVEVGPVVQTIIDLAEVEEIDLIAMASHGRTGLSHVFYGSVAAGVLHRVDRPLLLVRAE